MLWTSIGNIRVSDDGFHILLVDDDGTTTHYMPCVGGYMARITHASTEEQAKAYVEALLADPTDY